MFHGGRSGSTVLGLMLQEHPRVFWAGEVYEEDMAAGNLPVPSDREAPIRFLRRDMRRAGRRYYGMEVKFTHLRMLDLTAREYIERIERIGFDHFVVLHRRNGLRALVSVAIAGEDKRYHQGADAPPVLRRTTIPIETTSPLGEKRTLIDRLTRRHDNFSHLENALNGRNVLRLTYEDDVNAGPRVGYHRICSFLGIAPGNPPIRLSRTNPFSLREIISNVDEVEQVLEGSPYRWMLDE